MEIKRGALIISSIFLILVLILVKPVYSQEIGIEIDNSYTQNEEINFVITLYDVNKDKINGEVEYSIRNYYKELVLNGKSNSGEKINFILPENAYQGPWEISAVYNGIERKEIFNVGELKKINITLKGDNLIVKNTGNVYYDNNILIFIGENHQTARIFLDISETKIIHLTAPDGKYNVRISLDGSEENEIIYNDVSLTGNVIGIERVIQGNFFEKYPLVSLFLVLLLFLGGFYIFIKNK